MNIKYIGIISNRHNYMFSYSNMTMKCSIYFENMCTILCMSYIFIYPFIYDFFMIFGCGSNTAYKFVFVPEMFCSNNILTDSSLPVIRPINVFVVTSIK